MRDRHVARLCRSCDGPMAGQENVCWRCGAQWESDTPPLHVVPDRVGGGRVEREGAEHALSQHDSVTAAEGAAVDAARDTDTPDVVIHDRYDRVRVARP
jgi:hypothetical protein